MTIINDDQLHGFDSEYPKESGGSRVVIPIPNGTESVQVKGSLLKSGDYRLVADVKRNGKTSKMTLTFYSEDNVYPDRSKYRWCETNAMFFTNTWPSREELETVEQELNRKYAPGMSRKLGPPRPFNLIDRLP